MVRKLHVTINWQNLIVQILIRTVEDLLPVIPRELAEYFISTLVSGKQNLAKIV